MYSKHNAAQPKISAGFLKEMTPAMIFDYMAIRMDKQMMASQDFTMNITLMNLKQQYVLHIKNGVLLVYNNTNHKNVDVSITCPKNARFYQ